MHVLYSSYSKTLPGSCAPDPLVISNDKDLLWKQTDTSIHDTFLIDRGAISWVLSDETKVENGFPFLSI